VTHNWDKVGRITLANYKVILFYNSIKLFVKEIVLHNVKLAPKNEKIKYEKQINIVKTCW